MMQQDTAGMPGQFRPIDAVDLPPPRVAPTPPTTTVLGVAAGDGGTGSRPAIAAVRYHSVLVAPGDPLFGEQPLFETRYAVLGAERLDAGGGYPEVARRVGVLARRLYDRDSRGDYHAVVDAAGVGRPVVDAIRGSIIPQCHVTAAVVSTSGDGGDLSTLWRTETTISLAYLVSRLQAILQGRRLEVPASLASVLDELRAYEVEAAPSADLVRALSLACCSEDMPVRYDVSLDALPSARL